MVHCFFFNLFKSLEYGLENGYYIKNCLSRHTNGSFRARLVFRNKGLCTYFILNTSVFSAYFLKILKFVIRRPPPFSTTESFSFIFVFFLFKKYRSSRVLVGYMTVFVTLCLVCCSFCTSSYNHEVRFFFTFLPRRQDLCTNAECSLCLRTYRLLRTTDFEPC